MAKNNKNNKRNNHLSNSPYMTIPVEYGRQLIKQALSNPRNPKRSTNYSNYSEEDILNWLQSPAQNEKNLRNASIYMYNSQMHYQRLLNYYAGLYVGAYTIVPVGYSSKNDNKNFANQFKKISNVISMMNIPQMMRVAFLVALREGAYFGILVSDSNSAFIQKIPADYCSIYGICDGSFVYKVDMTKVADKLEFFPPEFSKMYTKYMETGEKWQEVPTNMAVCIKSDDTAIEYTIPPFSSLLIDSDFVKEARENQRTSSGIRNYKMVTGVIPHNEKGLPTMNDRMVDKYYQHIANGLDENIGLALTPFNLQTLDFDSRNAMKDIDDYSNAVANFWSAAGTSGLLHGRENNTSGVTKLAIKNDETFVMGMVQQFERIINRFLKTNFSGSTKFKINILPITVFNKEEYLKYYKEAAAFGLGKSQYASALGIGQNDIEGLIHLETEIIPFDKLKPLKSTYTMSGEESSEGRPQKDDDELGDAGEATRDNDTNANR